MLAQVDADRAERFQVKFLNILRRRLQDHLQLLMLEEAIGIFAVTSIRRTTRRLHIGNFVRLWPQYSQESFRSHGARADLDIVWLLQHTSALRPESLQTQDQLLKGQRIGFC